ncbi:stAR-related lipid transfer protein 7, mitochondrial [Copidosoma floridanum]|uniref:stAR-related lipid transfer protein 7, mitochondrial n=1 Tax=Copidosoma floridanum TaxID=29053 RepID=UPI0006C99F7B|nr:stAR-related lipid transfer protein 7, mitochondrial [Copidosoma floridanum]
MFSLSRCIGMSGASWLKRYQYNSNLTHEGIKLFSQNQAHGRAHLYHSNRLHSKFKLCRLKMSSWLREQGIQVFRACTRQCEFIAAQRVKRSIQIFYLYTRLWDEVALNEFLRSIRHRIARNTSNFLAGAVGFTIYNWEQERIADEEILSYSQEIEGLYKLKDLTVVCSKCHLRLIVDGKQPEIEYCQCHDVKCAVKKAEQEGSEWEPFIERQDMLVWRREEKNASGLYSYKVYGSFDDVSAEDFLQVQIDIDYRKDWDATAKELEVIDTDPKFEDVKDSCSDVIYWEMIWPRMFANRDYVYQRRWLYNEETGVVVIVSKETSHPKAPVRSDTYRVTTYWSYMVIRPQKNFYEPGIEFVLTYFDDPGVNIPSAVTAWVAMSGFPDYLCRMREAGKNYKSYKMQKSIHLISESMTTTDDQEDNLNVNNETSDQSNETISGDIEISEETIDLKSFETLKFVEKESDITLDETKKEEPTEAQSAQEDTQGFFDYLLFAKLFA